MFLALKEMRKEKLRYSLIIAMIVLISYLIFILTSLALGLAQQNTDAINSWGMQSIIMNKDADISLSQSLIKKIPSAEYFTEVAGLHCASADRGQKVWP